MDISQQFTTLEACDAELSWLASLHVRGSESVLWVVNKMHADMLERRKQLVAEGLTQ